MNIERQQSYFDNNMDLPLERMQEVYGIYEYFLRGTNKVTQKIEQLDRFYSAIDLSHYREGRTDVFHPMTLDAYRKTHDDLYVARFKTVPAGELSV